MKKNGFFRVWGALCVAAALLILTLWTMWGNTALTVSEAVIESSRIPSSFSGFRIAQVSDLHNAEFGENNVRLLQMLAENTPDLIVITGDLVDAGHTNIDAALRFIEGAVQIAPVYCVTGNHEAALPRYDILKAGLEGLGAAVLADEAVQLERGGEKITLAGLSDPDFVEKSALFAPVSSMTEARLRRLIDGEKGYTILLSHRPELFYTYVSCGIDLVLAGHAHGGQFRLPFTGGLIAPNQGLFPQYDAGLYTNGSTTMMVSRGIGNSVIPFRFNNPPEIVLLELRAL